MASRFDSILITGGSGMLGRALQRACASRGLHAIALGRCDCDITSPTDVRRVFDAYRPTLVLNCAGHTAVDRCEQETGLADAINGYGVGTLAQEAGRHGAFLVHYSTDFVFDGQASRPYRPEDPNNPLSAYGRSKLLGEQELARHSISGSWLLLRTAWLFSSEGACFPRTILNCARAGKPLRVVDDQFGSPTCADDLAGATLDLLERGATGTVHAVNRGSASWFEFARATLALCGLEEAADFGPISTSAWCESRPGQAIRPSRTILDVGPVEEFLGRAMRHWRDALGGILKGDVAVGALAEKLIATVGQPRCIDGFTNDQVRRTSASFSAVSDQAERVGAVAKGVD